MAMISDFQSDGTGSIPVRCLYTQGFLKMEQAAITLVGDVGMSPHLILVS